MSILIHCPACSAPIGNIGSDGTLQAICASCWYKFEAIYGSVTARVSEVEPVRSLPRLPQRYRRKYEFRLSTPQEVQLQYSTRGQEDWLPVHPGDRVSFLYTLRAEVREALIAVTNHTTGKTYRLSSPERPALSLAVKLSFLSGIPLLLVLLPNGVEFPVAMLTAIGSMPVVSVIVAKLRSSKAKIDASQRLRLVAEQKLLGEKGELQQRLAELQQKYSTNQERIDQLISLNQKMVDVGTDLYAKRIEKVSRAIALLEPQLTQEQHLIDQYVRTIKMVEIELETSRAVEQLPDAEDFLGIIFARLSELRTIDQKNQQLRSQVEADEEVKSLQP